MTSQSLSRRLIAIWATCLAFTAALLGYAVLGSTTRYMADDYWTAYVVRTTPFWQLPAFWYSHWSGRFTFFFLVSLAEEIGVRVVPILPFLALLSLVSFTTLLAWHWLRRFHLQWPFPAALLSATLFVYCTVHSTPNVLQSLYWQTGMLTYFAPIVLFVAYLALVSRLAERGLIGWQWLWLALSGLLAFFTGGFSETSIAIQVTTFALGFLICGLMMWMGHRRGASGWGASGWGASGWGASSWHARNWLPWMGIGLAASLIAMAVMILAPGNQVRLAGNAPHLDVVYVLSTAVRMGLRSLITALRTYPLDALIAFAIPACAAFFLVSPTSDEGRPVIIRNAWITIAVVAISVVLLIISGNAPAYYVMHSGPPIRTEVIQQAILTAGLIIIGMAGGTLTRFGIPLGGSSQRWIATVTAVGILILLALGPGRFLLKASVQYPALREYAAQWEARDTILRQAARKGQRTITVRQIGQLDQSLGDLRAEPDFWINQKAADYYGLQSISAK